jgi:hypothetical protein
VVKGIACAPPLIRCLLGRYGQTDGEYTALSERAAHLDMPAVKLHDPPNDGQPRACALIFVELALDLVEDLENRLKLTRGNATAIISNL